MKVVFALALFLISASSFACPYISGTFKDEDDNLVTIAQKNCDQLDWSDSDISTTLIADNVERIVMKEGNDIAYGKARFTKTDFVVELRLLSNGKPPKDYPAHFLTSYRIDKFNNMVEKIVSTQGTQYITFRRIK